MNEYTINYHVQINKVLNDIDGLATKAINNKKKLMITVEEVGENDYTKKQRGALHVWCSQVAETLNAHGAHFAVRYKTDGSEMLIEWDKDLVKKYIYKVVLNALTDKTSTEDQNTVQPSMVAQHITRHFATRDNPIFLPDWPSLR